MAGPLLNAVHANSAYSNTLLHSLDSERFAVRGRSGWRRSFQHAISGSRREWKVEQRETAKGGCSRIEARLIVEHTPRTTTRWIDEETFAPWQISFATGFTGYLVFRDKFWEEKNFSIFESLYRKYWKI